MPFPPVFVEYLAMPSSSIEQMASLIFASAVENSETSQPQTAIRPWEYGIAAVWAEVLLLSRPVVCYVKKAPNLNLVIVVIFTHSSHFLHTPSSIFCSGATFRRLTLITIGKPAKSFQQKWLKQDGLCVTARDAASGSVRSLGYSFCRAFGRNKK